MTKTMSSPVYDTADRRQVASVYSRIVRVRSLAKGQPDLVGRHMVVASLRAAASSQNIEGGHSTPLDVARAVVKSGNTLKSA